MTGLFPQIPPPLLTSLFLSLFAHGRESRSVIFSGRPSSGHSDRLVEVLQKGHQTARVRLPCHA